MKSYMNWRRKSDNSTTKMILGTVAGMAVGLTAGLLTAPCAGKDMRRILFKRTNEVLEKAGKTLSESKQQEE
ncbi:YtxH domain-containing protein [Desulfocastanea catecholica]